jgi:peroxiredoxin
MFRVWLALFMLLPLLAACANDDEDGTTVEFVTTGDDVPDFDLFDIDGKRLSSSMLKGQIYILNFFDTSCPDCRKELQILQTVYDKYGETVPLLNVPRSQTLGQAQAYWTENGLTLPLYGDASRGLYYRFATRTVPRTYIVDGTGKVSKMFTDAPIADFETLDGLLQELLAASEYRVKLSLQLKVSAPARAAEDYHFHNEYTISKLELFFFDAETKKLADKRIIYGEKREADMSVNDYDITYVFDNVNIKAGVYDVFAIANYDHTPNEITDEYEFLNQIDNITYSSGIEANIPDYGPVMTSHPTSALGVDFVPYINRSYVMEMEMERVLVKLQIGVARNTFVLKHNSQKYADINITNYKFVNLNTSYYLFPHKDILPEFQYRSTFEIPENFDTYVDEGDAYVVDPMFYEKRPVLEKVRRYGQYCRLWFGNFTTDDFASMPSADNLGYAYILENTFFKDSQKNGYSPGVVFKAAVSPVFVYLYDAEQGALVQEYRPEYWPETIYFYNYDFYGTILALNVASGLNLDELVDYTDEQLKVYAVKQCKFNMGAYETFYTYWIRHRNTSDDNLGPMEYGVVRNNFYKMIVSGVSGLGNSCITPDVLRDNYPNSYADVEITP